MKNLGILFNPRVEAARLFAGELESAICSNRASAWVGSAWEEMAARRHMADLDLVFSVGGDGTILRSARIVAPLPVPILGVNLGRLGFLTEMETREALASLPRILAGEGWLEERTRLEVEFASPDRIGAGSQELPSALNDVMVGRGAVPRIVLIEARIDGDPLTVYRTDGLILSTATGSTAYALAAGGPILHPSLDAILVQPLAAHLNLTAPLVVPGSTQIELSIHTDHAAVLSVDGQVDVEVRGGDIVRVRRSPHTTRFLRLGPPGDFYRRLAQKLLGNHTRSFR